MPILSYSVSCTWVLTEGCYSGWASVDIDEFPALKQWRDRLLARPGFEKGRHVPSEHTALKTLSPEEADKLAKAGSAWVVQGMKQDAK